MLPSRIADQYLSEPTWAAAVAEGFGIPSSIPLDFLDEATQAVASGFWQDYEDAGEEGEEEALDAFLDYVGEALEGIREDASEVVEQIPTGTLEADPEAAGGVAKEAKGTRNPMHLVMMDFDGTLFNSQGETPDWWTKPGQYSWGADPRSLEEPCIPKHPVGSEYWNMKVVNAAREATSDPSTYLVLVTGRIAAHEPRIKELLAQQGIHPDGFYFNSGVRASAFKKRVFGVLFINFPTMRTLDIWEDENNDVYGAFVRGLSKTLVHDIDLEVHRVSEKVVPVACGPADFPGEMRTAAAHTGVGLFIPVPDSLAGQFPKSGDRPHVTLLYVGTVLPGRQAEFKGVVARALGREPGPVYASFGEPDFFVQPEKDRRVWYSCVQFSKDVAAIRDRVWNALSAAGFEVQHSFPLSFVPHATLAYVEGDSQSHARWEGVVPQGSWSFDSVEVWGLPGGAVEVPLGSYVPHTLSEAAASRVASQFLASSTEERLATQIAEALGKIVPHTRVFRSKRDGAMNIAASDTKNGADRPATVPGTVGANGIFVTLQGDRLVFWEITAAAKGKGGQMVEAVLKEIPRSTKISVHVDWSGGFWTHMKEKYPQYDWGDVD